MFDNTSFKLLEKGLDVTWYKQKVISQNIANDSTPGYKAKTVDFKAVINKECNSRKSIGEKKNKVDYVMTVTEEPYTNQTLDGNNVDAEKEGVALADAQIQYETLIGKLKTDFGMIRTALQR